MKRSTLIVAVGLLVHSAAYPTNSLSKEDIATGAFMAAGAFAGYLFYSWVTHKSDAHVVDAAQRVIEATEQQYAPLMALADRYTDALLDSQEFSLTTLLQAIQTHCIMGTSYTGYLNHLNSSLSELEHVLAELKKRINGLNNTSQQEQLYKRACVVFEHLTLLQGSLRIMYTCLETHRGYFKLKATYDTCEHRYARLIPIAYQLGTNPYLVEAIANQMQSALSYESHYIYLDFYTQLIADCKELASALTSPSRHYHDLHDHAQGLLSWLDFLADSIVKSNRFALESFFKQSRSLDLEIDELTRKQQQLYDKQAKALLQSDVFAQRSIAVELQSVTRLIEHAHQKKRDLRSKVLGQASNSFTREYHNVA